MPKMSSYLFCHRVNEPNINVLFLSNTWSKNKIETWKTCFHRSRTLFFRFKFQLLIQIYFAKSKIICICSHMCICFDNLAQLKLLKEFKTKCTLQLVKSEQADTISTFNRSIEGNQSGQLWNRTFNPKEICLQRDSINEGLVQLEV